MSDWQPMDTAPKDGTTKILLWWEHSGVGIGWWAYDEIWQERKWAHKAMEHGWQCEGDACIPVNQEDCTHWMSLPGGPQTTPPIKD
jgi:hypothetical protein